MNSVTYSTAVNQSPLEGLANFQADLMSPVWTNQPDIK